MNKYEMQAAIIARLLTLGHYNLAALVEAGLRTMPADTVNHANALTELETIEVERQMGMRWMQHQRGYGKPDGTFTPPVAST